MRCRGYTRKEPFATSFWSPKAENWNGRLAMVGFALLITVEALTGYVPCPPAFLANVTVNQAGLQEVLLF